MTAESSVIHLGMPRPALRSLDSGSSLVHPSDPSDPSDSSDSSDPPDLPDLSDLPDLPDLSDLSALTRQGCYRDKPGAPLVSCKVKYIEEGILVRDIFTSLPFCLPQGFGTRSPAAHGGRVRHRCRIALKLGRRGPRHGTLIVTHGGLVSQQAATAVPPVGPHEIQMTASGDADVTIHRQRSL
jgi:hypothetical protein